MILNRLLRAATLLIQALQGRLDAAVEQRVAEGAAAARDLSSARAELDTGRAAAAEADAAVTKLRGRAGRGARQGAGAAAPAG